MFASLFVVSLASALVIENTTALVQPTSVAHNAGSMTLSTTLNYTGASASTVATFSVSNTNQISSVSPSTVTLTAGVPQSVTLTLGFSAFQTGSLAGNLIVTPSSGTALTLPYSVAINSSSTFSVTKTADITSTQNGSFTITNTGNQAITFAPNASGALNVSISPTSVTLAPNTTSTAFTVTPLAGQTGIGSKSVTININGQTLSFSKSFGFCPAGKKTTNLTITDVDLSNSGDDDDVWSLLDTVSFDVEVENNGDSDLRDVVIELGLFDANGKNVINDLDFISDGDEEYDVGKIKDGDHETITFEFKVPADVDTGSYTLIAKAYDDKISQSELCTDSVADGKSQKVTIEEENDEGKFIGFDNIVVSPAQATCGDEVTVSADAVNIGGEDQDRILTNLVNRALGINKIIEITAGLDKGDSKMVSFSFTVPQVADGTYNLALSAEYDYKNGVYKQNLDDDVETQLKVFGCSVAPGTTNAVSINAELASEAVTGKDVKVTATLRNNGDKTALFAITATGFESWASVKSISENIVQIPAGQSKDVTITLTPQEDAAGEQSFTINARTDDGKVQSRQVVVQVENGSLFGGSSWVWTLVAINVVLVILIIVVAVIVSRR